MRKALTFSAIALASSMALAAPVAAFAADSHGLVSAATVKYQAAEISFSSQTVAPGDHVTVTVKVRKGSSKPTVTSAAFKEAAVPMTDDGTGVWTGTATIKGDMKDGTYPVYFAGSGGSGQADLKVADKRSSISLSATTAKPGDQVTAMLKMPKGASKVLVSSQALGNVTAHQAMDGAWTATAKVGAVKDGVYDVKYTGIAADGSRLSGSTKLTVKADAPVPPVVSSVTLSKNSGVAGDKIEIAIQTNAKDAKAYVDSAAFGGKVELKDAGNGVWTGTATVAKGLKAGAYGVDAFAGGKKFDTVTFSAKDGGSGGGGGGGDVTPDHHVKPHGGVNTGQAPVGFVTSND
ncbi:hypothetical protein OHS33_18150 [Streptomyces sp. NBC_00536]|uniref:hypothetical protein n=1 Tax=Streptomyces sp. NBC_00536 TaxID=2975769 RepID=UPI002E80EFAA|nr:hypothetical protein [Streptomyces sp. NBC_00536]WUC80100.1 hypothetical protein OHS33_18150 [Streptomyces sp. NBC_00536]